MDLWLYGVSRLPITLTQFTTFYLFTLMSHDLKVIFWVPKLLKIYHFLTLKNYAAIIYLSLAHLGLWIIEVGCFEFICTHLVH